MLSFNMSVTDLDKAVNGITGTTNVSKFAIEDYNLALSQGGGVAASVGVNFSDFNASIAAISPLFASGSDAGTSFKTMLLRLIPQSDGAISAMRELGIITKEGQNRFFDATGKMQDMATVSGVLSEAFTGLSDAQKNQYMNTIFGTDALRAASALANTGSTEFLRLKDAIDNTDAAKNAKDRLDNLSGSMETLSGSVDELFIMLGSVLAPGIRAVVDVLTIAANKISDLYGMFTKLPQPIQDVVGIFSAVAVGGVLLTGVWAAMTFAMGGVIAAFGALLVAAAPWILLASAIAAGLYLLYTAWETNFYGIRDIATSVFTYLSETFNRIATEWGPILQTALTNIVTIFQAAFEGIVAVVVPIITSIVGFIQSNWTQIMEITTAIWGMIKGYFDMTLGLVIGVFKAFFQVLGGDWAGAWETLKQTLVTAFEGLKLYITSYWEVVKGVFNLAFEGIKTLASAAWDSFSSTMSEKFGQIKTTFTDIWNGISTFFSELTEKIFQTLVTFVGLFDGDFNKFGERMAFIWGDWWGKILTAAGDIFGKISEVATKKFNEIKANLASNWEGIKNLWSTTWDSVEKIGKDVIASISAFFSGGGKEAMDNGMNAMLAGLGGIASKIFNGILGTIEGFVNTAVNMINGLIDSANKLPGMSIPRVSAVSFGRLAHGGIAGEGFFGGEVMKFANGGVVGGARGIDAVPAMLTAGEVVLNAAQQAKLASRLGGEGSGGGIIIDVHDNEFTGDETIFAQKILDIAVQEFKRHTSFESFST
jgi:TP901 family phage tail tape measure protein